MATPTTRTTTTNKTGPAKTGGGQRIQSIGGGQGKISTFTQWEHGIDLLCARNNIPRAVIGTYLGEALPSGNTDHNVKQYVGRIWLWTGMRDVATVIAPSADTAANQALNNAAVMLPQLLKQAGLTRRAA